MCKSDNPTMHFNPQNIFAGMAIQEEDRDSLGAPFSAKEIDEVVKSLPNDTSPRPDGFNNEFFKNYLSVIGSDVKTLIQDFFDGKVTLESINSSFITLIPKVVNPCTLGDFRPISLLNYVLKIITKLLANMLQLVILKLVHKTNMVS
jgi:hypothetical protein